MSGTTGTIPLQDVIDDQLITPALWNGEFANISGLMDAAGCGGHSDTDSDAQIQTAPYPGSVLSKATSIAGELERLRYQLAQILGTDFWYKPAATDLTSVGNVVVPLGGTIEYPVATPPSTNWHLEDGTAISRAGYPSLFALIGTTFGIGDGTTTFNLPDSRDRVAIAAGTTYAAGDKGGSATHTLSDAELPATAVAVVISDPGHVHTATDSGHTHGVTDPGHTHGIACTASATSSGKCLQASGATTSTPSTNSATTGVTVNSSTANVSVASHSTGITASGTVGGSGTAHNILNPYIGKYKMMRVL